ncbi:MAG: asparagine synthase (glutamine-hydrolyzing) [Gemmatimonadaceae bacterium]|nr:asparagine synthase (glutamine-hydrolyzing) [Chitinophagaceae bacterium]
MCGIAGIISLNRKLVSADRLKKMTDSIAHRGPDGQAHWVSEEGNAGFGHRRLCIIDLREIAAQPMSYLGRYTIIHNGEIYNYLELRESLIKDGYSFRTESDTEVILASYAKHGASCVSGFDGMFAFAIWDEQEQLLFVARDRLGEKPFYFYKDEKQLIFASEMKALWAAGVEKQVNERMLFNYLTLGYTQNPGNAGETYYNNIYKLPARFIMTYDLKTDFLQRSAYWDIDLKKEQFQGNDEEAISEFHRLFTESVSRRLRSDVPLGTSLSGGLDSSSITAELVRKGQKEKTKSFSATFPGFQKDESAFISKIISRHKIENNITSPNADEFINDFEKLCYHQEEPFQSASIYAQYRVYELAKQNGVTVLLDGQGADEIMAGYHKYFPRYWQELLRTDKKKFKLELQYARNNGVTEAWNWKNRLAASFPINASLFRQNSNSRKQERNPDINKGFIRQFGDSYYEIPAMDQLNSTLYYNTFLNGLEELLRYADRNSMAHAREVRLPFLSHELVTFLFSLPSHFKIRNGYTKWILRKAMENELPAEIAWRKDKTGFEPPQKLWFSHPGIHAQLNASKEKLVDSGVLNPSVMDKKNQPLDAHAADNYDWRYLVAGALL